MKAVLLYEYGDADQLRYEDIDLQKKAVLGGKIVSHAVSSSMNAKRN
ncbi:MAG TPA: hypothetical protein VFE27_00055 [Acidobacteriaceae bacterium]|jgi:hypothetical protein|nr:hypothetical protein [Acidobacteriaceae bacterium]